MQNTRKYRVKYLDFINCRKYRSHSHFSALSNENQLEMSESIKTIESQTIKFPTLMEKLISLSNQFKGAPLMAPELILF